MDLSHPHTAVCPTLDGAVLAVLAGTTRRLTGREVARLAGRRSHRGVLLALDRLVAQGLVDREEAGSALLFTLNRDHLAAPTVELLAGLREELVSRLREAIRGWEVAPVHASWFGSTARGEGDAESDIDLFIVRPDEIEEDDARWRDQIDSLATNVRRWTGNHAGIAEVAAGEVARLRRDRPSIVGDLISDSTTLCGRKASRFFEARA